METPEVSICIVAGHDLALLDACLSSLAAQVDAPRFEVLVADNHDAGDTAPQVERWFPGAQVIPTFGVLPGAARNPLVAAARGALLLFLDDDITAPPTLLRSLVELAAQHPEAVVFGGPNDTPPRSSHFQIVQGAVLASFIGAGPVCRRYGARHGGPADERWFTLCNLAIRREVMPLFSSDLVCAEENAVLAELWEHGARMRYAPELVVFHERRDSTGSFARQMHKYGRGRGALMRRDTRTVRLAFLAPSALLLYALGVLVLALAGALSLPVLVPGALYALLALATGAWVALTLRRPAAAVAAAGLVVVVHACYGSGVLRGLCARASKGAEPAPAPVVDARTDESAVRDAEPARR